MSNTLVSFIPVFFLTDQEGKLFRPLAFTKTFAIGDYQLQPKAARKSVNFAYPVLTHDGLINAVIFAALDVTWINQLAAENNLPKGVSVSVVDSKGTLLARFPEPEKWVGKHIPDASLFEMLQLRSQVSRDLVGLDGVDRLYALKPLSPNVVAGQIFVMVGIPKDVAFGQANRTLARNLIWLALVSLSATAIAWLIGSKFVVGYVKTRAEAEEERHGHVTAKDVGEGLACPAKPAHVADLGPLALAHAPHEHGGDEPLAPSFTSASIAPEEQEAHHVGRLRSFSAEHPLDNGAGQCVGVDRVPAVGEAAVMVVERESPRPVKRRPALTLKLGARVLRTWRRHQAMPIVSGRWGGRINDSPLSSPPIHRARACRSSLHPSLRG